MTARVHSTPQRPFPFAHPVSSSPLSPTALPSALLTVHAGFRSACLYAYTLPLNILPSLIRFSFSLSGSLQPYCCRGPLTALLPTTGVFSPFCDRCPLRVYALSPSAIGARGRYILCRGPLTALAFLVLALAPLSSGLLASTCPRDA